MTATFPYRRLGDVLRSLWWMAWAAGDQMALPRPMEETTRIMAHDEKKTGIFGRHRVIM